MNKTMARFFHIFDLRLGLCPFPFAVIQGEFTNQEGKEIFFSEYLKSHILDVLLLSITQRIYRKFILATIIKTHAIALENIHKNSEGLSVKFI